MTDFETDIAETSTSIRRLMRWFLAGSVLLVGGVGGWSATAEVESAVITAGTFAPQSDAQAVQHLEGGVVGAILVKEGERVSEGQVVVRLDAAKVTAETAIAERRLVALAAERARLLAEREGRPLVPVPQLLLTTPEATFALAAAVAAEQGILAERTFGLESRLAQLKERRRQTEMQIGGLERRLAAVREELEQAEGELADKRYLDAKGLMRRPVLRQAERDVSRLKGEIGDMESRIGEAESRLAETALELEEKSRARVAEILTRLNEVEARFAEADEEAKAARDRATRLEIRAPRTGHVHELAVHTLGGVVAPGQTVMRIIPSDEPLVVDASIPPDEIDQVRVGQPVVVRVSAFQLPVAPELDGTVVRVSPDKIEDPRTGRAHFSVTVSVAASERAKLEGKELTPGLPAEVFLRGESRRVITYLTRPLTEKLELAFRE